MYGINAESIVLHKDSTYGGFVAEIPDPENNDTTIEINLNKSDRRRIVYDVPDELEDNILYIQLNEYGYPKRLYCKSGSELDIGTVYLELEYTPENEYETIYQYFENKILAAANDKAEYDGIVTTKINELKETEKSVQALLEQKNDLNSKLERILGPALREGYWTPDDYEDHAS